MTYPLSNEVAAGDATEASQYNNLRRDALFLGNDPGSSGNLMQLLAQGMGEVKLTQLSEAAIRLEASASSPCAVMINGKIFAVTANLPLMLSGVTMPAAGRYFLYAVGQTDGTFTLYAGSSGPDNSRRIGTFLWDGTGMIPGSLTAMEVYRALLVVNIPQIVNGRLTLISGNPVPDGEVTAADTLYFTPYGGNKIGLMVGGEWALFTFSELYMSLSGMTKELPYDIFVSVDRNGIALSSTPWGSVSARTTSPVYVDGVPVSAADPNKRYLGTIVKNAAGYGEDSLTGRLLWNQYNRVQRPMLYKLPEEGTGSFSMNDWAPYYSDAAAPAVRMIVPSAETAFELSGTGISNPVTDSDASYTRFFFLGIGQDPSTESPYPGNDTCVPVYTRSMGNAPVTVTIRNYGSGFHGYHTYMLLYWTNYSIAPRGKTALLNDTPGLWGYIMG